MATQLQTSTRVPALGRQTPADCLLTHLLLTGPGRLADHHRRVSRLSEALGLQLGMGAAEAAKIGRAGSLHDIGMMLVPEELLGQTGQLSANEKEIIHQHCLWGSELLRMVSDPELNLAAKVALQHHERFNGTGYPLGLVGEEICLAARIVAVCAVYDALRHPREGKSPLSEAAALDVLRNGDADVRAGGFDPVVLDAFAIMLREIETAPVFAASARPAITRAAQPDGEGPLAHACPESGEQRCSCKVAIVENDETVRHSTAAFLRDAGHEVEAFTSSAEFLASDLRRDLGCILLDLGMPGLDGFAVMRALKARGKTPPVIILSGRSDVPTAVEAMRLGAADFLVKSGSPEELLAALARACTSLALPISSHWVADADAREKIAALTDRQRDVLRGILKGQRNKTIAHELGLSTRTVESDRAQLLDKLGVRGTAGAVKFAIAAGFAA